MHPYRSHTCGALTKANEGETVRLSGWVHRKRDHGGVLFVDLRDHYGITQVVADADSAALPLLEGLRVESVVTINGTVKGNDVTFWFAMSVEGTAMNVTYTGKIEADGSLKGSVNYGDMMSGTFSATRKK